MERGSDEWKSKISESNSGVKKPKPKNFGSKLRKLWIENNTDEFEKIKSAKKSHAAKKGWKKRKAREKKYEENFKKRQAKRLKKIYNNH
jgi:hypothetical protein